MKLLELQSELHLSECRKKAFGFITLFIIILSVYSNTFHASWHFDDMPNIVENRYLHLTELSWPNIKKTFFALPEPTRILYRPVACLSFAINYYFGKDNVLGYHIVNISIHFLAAIFLFLFIYHTLNLPLLKERYGTNSYFISLLSTILWAINPIQTQAITFIVQRMASMSGMFYIMSMYLYVKGRETTQTSTRIIFFILCAISGLLAFGSKENAIMLPVSLLLYDFLVFQGLSKENTRTRIKIIIVAAILTLSICIIYFALSQATFSSLFDLYSKRPFTLWERVMTESRVIIFYISLILYPMPTRLSLDHDVAVSSSLFAPPTTILSMIFIVGMVISAISISRRKPLISFSILFFFLNHLIESSIFPLELVFEHRNYVPSMLFFVPITIGLMNAISYFSYRRSMQIIITASLILVIIALGHASFIRNLVWKTEESLWTACVEKYPDLFRAHHNLGKYYFEHREEDKAIAEYEKALELKAIHNKKEKCVTYFNLAGIYFLRKEFQKAKRYYLQAINEDPCYRGVHNNLAVLLATVSTEHQRVYDHLEKALTCDPEDIQALSNMGILLVKIGRLDEGIVNLEKALEMDPENVPTLERLGYAYVKKGLLGKASIYFKRALNRRPKNIRALLYLAELYTLRGYKEGAQKSLSQFVDFAQDRDLGSLLDTLLGEDSLLRPTLDMTTLLPLLSKAYERKSLSLEKNRDFCLNALRNESAP